MLSPTSLKPQVPVILITSLLLVVSLVYLFARLGHYALWDDEAYTALGAEGVLATGDTSAIIDHNIVAFKGGIMLKNLCDRYTPPLATYLAAFSMAMFGRTSFAARLPFSVLGLACIALLGYWLWRSRASLNRWAVMTIALTGNVSFFLYCRQSRYYASVMFFTIALAYLYMNWRATSRHAVLFAVISALLLASNYIAYAAAYAALLTDYLLWGRRSIVVSRRQWLWLVGLQAVIITAIATVWNPFAVSHGSHFFANGPLQRLQLFYWNMRDLNRCEFGAGALLLAAPLVAFWCRDLRLFRGVIALLVCLTIVSLVSPQVVADTKIADVRYIILVIPMCMILAVITLENLTCRMSWLAIPLALLAFHTNLLNGKLIPPDGSFRSTTVSFVRELIAPPDDPYSVTADWINRNVGYGESILSLPDYTNYPLMFHAPKAVYAWQLKRPPEPQFEGLPPIHFQGQAMPDYVIAFGPVVQQVASLLQSLNHIKYRHVATIGHYWRELFRPELFWHSFMPVTNFDRNSEAIYIFQRQ